MSSTFLKTPAVPGASRAAANQSVPHNGIARPAVSTPPVLQGQGIMQLKIERLLAKGSDKQAIQMYMKGPVNTRNQTFSEAVEEVLVLFPELSSELGILKAWIVLQESLPGEDIERITDCITRLTEGVNTVYIQHTPYPNLAAKDLIADKPFTIPQSEESQARSLKLYNAIDQKAKELFKEVKKDSGAKKELGNLLRYDEEHDSYKGYMLGVLIMDGKVFATCSGGVSTGFKTIAESLGMQYVQSVMDVDAARAIVARELPPQNFGKDEEKNIVKEQGPGKEVKTGLTGTCAAPKLIWSIIDGSHVQLHPTTMRHASMTERWVSPLNNSSTVPIIDAHGRVIEYGSGDIVPSCKACQHLMHGLEDRLRRRLGENLNAKKIWEEQNSPENIEKRRIAKEQKEAMDREYNSETLDAFSSEVKELNEALTNLLDTILKGGNSILKEELNFLKDRTDKLEELRFNLQTFAGVSLGSSREAIVAALEQLKNGERVIDDMVQGITEFWKTAAERKSAEEQPVASSSKKSGNTRKKGGKR